MFLKHYKASSASEMLPPTRPKYPIKHEKQNSVQDIYTNPNLFVDIVVSIGSRTRLLNLDVVDFFE